MVVGIFADCWVVHFDLEIEMKGSQGWFISVSPLASPAGGLSGLRPQAACGVLALRVPIPDTLRGVGYAHPRRAALGAPFGEGEPRCGTPKSGPAAAGYTRSSSSVLAGGQHGALAARRIPGRMTLPPVTIPLSSPLFLRSVDQALRSKSGCS